MSDSPETSETPLQAATGHSYGSSKTYTHSQGLSCTFRQWRATDSHCRFLHGYALQVKVEFEATTLDARNWCVNFGGLKPFKAWLEETFDHKTLIAKDDPALEIFRLMNNEWHPTLITPEEGPAYHVGRTIQLVEVEHVGAESFARMIFEWLCSWDDLPEHVQVKRVYVNEHEANGANYGLLDCDYNRVRELTKLG